MSSIVTDVWTELNETRDFHRVGFSVLRDGEIREHFDGLAAESRRSRQNRDSMGKEITQESNVLAIASDQVCQIAKHLQSDGKQRFDSYILKMIKTMSSILKSGRSHESICVRKLERSDPCFDENIVQKVQYGCFAKDEISAGTVLAPYVGELKFEKYEHVPFSSEPKSRDDEMQEESQEIHSADFAMALCNVAQRGELFIDATECGNETAFINDGFEHSNALYVQATVNGIECIFVVLMRNVSKGDQICAEYGERYWQPRKQHWSKRNPHSKSSFQVLSCSSHASLQRERPQPGFYTEARSGDLFPTKLEYIKCCQDGFSAHYVFCVESLGVINKDRRSGIRLPQFLDDLPLMISPSKRQKVSPIEDNAVEGTADSSELDEDRVEHPEVVDDTLQIMRSYLQTIQLDPDLSYRAQIIAVVENLRQLIESSFELKQTFTSSIYQKFFQLLSNCKERVLGVQPTSVLFLGDTGVGKSFLVNLLLLLTAPLEEKYGLRLLLCPQLLAKIKAGNAQHQDDYHDERVYPQEILGQKISAFEGFTELCQALQKSNEEVMVDLIHQYRGTPPRIGCILCQFKRPSKEEIETDSADFNDLLMSCREKLEGARFQYLLPSQSAGKPTTSHLFKTRFGRILHAIVKFQSEEEIGEDLCAFQWGKNSESDGDRSLLNSYKKKLRRLYSLDEWPGTEKFRHVKMIAAVREYAGKVVLIAGKGSSLSEDRIFLRKQLFALTAEPEGQQQVGGNAAALLISECIVYAPSDLLESGLELVDSPGTNDEDPIKHSLTKAELQRADSVLVLLSGQITKSVLDMLEDTGILSDLLHRRCRPIAFVHTCDESKANLLTNTSFDDSRKSSGARRALHTCSSETLNTLSERLELHYNKKSDTEKMDLGSCVELVSEVIANVSSQTISCLPLLWASNLACDSKNDNCTGKSNGRRLLEVLLTLRKEGRTSSASGDFSLDALRTFAAECKALVDAQCCPPANVLFPDVARYLPIVARRMVPIMQDRLLEAFDHKVYKPLQDSIEQMRCGFLKEFTGRFTQGLSIKVEQNRLKQLLQNKRGVAVANAFQKSLKGNYSGLSLFNAIFVSLKKPDDKELAEHFKSKIDNLCVDFLDNIRNFFEQNLRGHVQDILSRERNARSRSAHESKAVHAALSKAVDAFFETDTPGQGHVMEEFECCFGRPGGRGAFSGFGLRSMFVSACEKSLTQRVLMPAGEILLKQSTEDLKAELQSLISDNLSDIYQGVKDEFAKAVSSELDGRARKLYNRFVARRVRKGGPLSLISLFQSCVETVLPAGHADKGDDPREMEMIRVILAHVETLLQGREAGGDDGAVLMPAQGNVGSIGPVSESLDKSDPVVQIVDLIKRRRQREQRALEAMNSQLQ